jgi:hypothetical protein
VLSLELPTSRRKEQTIRTVKFPVYFNFNNFLLYHLIYAGLEPLINLRVLMLGKNRLRQRTKSEIKFYYVMKE